MKEGLAILDVLQPPPGFVTEAALGTSYSADLVACMVALTAQDFSADDAGEYKRMQAFRALERLRANVRIAVQQGRISGIGKTRRVLALLDRIVRPVAFDGNELSFHPKVWVIRQSNEDRQSRWVLLVGSRNLTASSSWDLGIALEGTSGTHKGASRRLERLPAFVDRVCELIDEPAFADRFAGLEDVRWLLPPGVTDLEFWFQPGGAPSGAVDDAKAFHLGRAERALILSPFLDSEMVKRSAAYWGGKDVRLVAGRPDLEKVWWQGAQTALTSLHPHHLALVEDAADAPDADPVRDGERIERGLHAKVIGLIDGERSTLLVGSPNLTRRAFCGPNCEAALILRGTGLVEPLWEWSQNATEFQPPEGPPPELKPRERLDRLRNELAALHFRLAEDPARCELDAGTALGLIVDGKERASFSVARLTTPRESLAWPAGTRTLAIPPVRLADRTAFLLFSLRWRGEEVCWVQSVQVTPPIDDARDRAAVMELLGVDGFLRYLSALVDGEGGGADDDGDDDDDDESSRSTKRPGGGQTAIRLEDVVRLIALEGDRSPRLAELRATVDSYRSSLLSVEPTAEERRRLQQFWLTWEAIEEGIRIP